LANDASTDEWVSTRLRELQIQDARVKVVDRPTNGGIVAASNDAIAVAQGEFLVLLDNDDELGQDALRLVAEAIDLQSTCDYLYSDENKITPEGEHFDSFLKPTWSPERLLAQNYTSHLSVLRRSLVELVGRFRPGFEGSQDYDLILRVIERARTVVHVPHVLYHWRALSTSTASSASAKPYAFVAALGAVREHLHRTGVVAEVSEAGPSLARVHRTPTDHPEITVILPIDTSQHRIFGVETALSKNVTASLAGNTTYNNTAFTFVTDERVGEKELSELIGPFEDRATIVRVPQSHSLPQQLNAGLIACTTSMAVLLDPHCEFIESDWIETLLGYTTREHVAMVAPVLVDEFGNIVSAGLSFAPEPHEIGQGRHITDLGPVGMFAIARECFGVSTRCALIDAVAVKRVGGFSPDYSGRWCDFDLACKLHAVGKHSIVTPLASVRCYDAPLRWDDDRALIEDRWGRFVGADPFTRVETRLRENVNL